MPDRCREVAALPFTTTTTHDRTAELRHMVKPDNRGRSLKRAAAAPPRVVRRTNAFLGSAGSRSCPGTGSPPWAAWPGAGAPS